MQHKNTVTERVLAVTIRGDLEIVNFGRKPKGTEKQPKDPNEAESGISALLAEKGLKMLPK